MGHIDDELGIENKKKFQVMLGVLKADGVLKTHFHQLRIDISNGKKRLELVKTKDREVLRLIIAGKQLVVNFIKGSFETAVHIFENIDFKIINISWEEIWNFNYESYKVKLIKDSCEKYWWEVESTSEKDDTDLFFRVFGLKSNNPKIEPKANEVLSDVNYRKYLERLA